MIILENRLTEVFDQLPEIDGFKPVFDFGNQFHLDALLKRYSENNTCIYPLVYLDITEYDEQHERFDSEMTTNIKLIVACQNTDTTLLNKNRWAMSYDKILFPMADNIKKSFRGSGIFNWDGNTYIHKHPNYGNGDENKTIDIWDAITIRLNNVIITNNCVSQINFY